MKPEKPTHQPASPPPPPAAQAWAEQVLAQAPQVHAFDGVRCERMVQQVLQRMAAERKSSGAHE